MNKNLLITLSLVAIVALAGGYFFLNSNQTKTMELDDAMMITDHNDNTGESMEADDTMVQEGAMDKNDKSETMMEDTLEKGQYVSYSSDYLTKYKGKTKVLFFHASWCPTCKVADRDIKNNLANIPGDAVIIKTDYDKEKDLKKKYGVTYQHTFVIVDDNGNELSKWNGGDFKEILRRI